MSYKGKSGNFSIGSAAFGALCGALLLLAAAGLKSSADILIGPPYSLVVRAFTGGGGEVEPTASGRELIGAIGVSGVARMEGGDFKIGTGIIGGIAPSGINLDKAHVFPNPYIPSEGHVGVTFSQLTSQATVRVYTLSGELVQELFKNDTTSDRLAWNPVENKQGQPLASGVYIYLIEASDGQVKTGKMMVIK